jgi:hypothetical protein
VEKIRERHQAELGHKCKIAHDEYPVSFTKLNKIPKVVKPVTRHAKELIILANADKKIYRFKIFKDSLT